MLGAALAAVVLSGDLVSACGKEPAYVSQPPITSIMQTTLLPSDVRFCSTFSTFIEESSSHSFEWRRQQRELISREVPSEHRDTVLAMIDLRLAIDDINKDPSKLLDAVSGMNDNQALSESRIASFLAYLSRWCPRAAELLDDLSSIDTRPR